MLKHTAAMILLLILPVYNGCSSTSRPEDLAGRSMDEVFTEVDKLSENGLKERAAQYTKALKFESEKMQQLRQEEEKLGYSEKTGPKAIQISKQMKEVGNLINRLSERRQEYVNKLQEKKVDTSDYR